MDISQPFSLIPEGFDKNVNKKRSLFIGCNYSDNTEAQLKGAHDDIRSLKVSSIEFVSFHHLYL